MPLETPFLRQSNSEVENFKFSVQVQVSLACSVPWWMGTKLLSDWNVKAQV
jgi:hypothetical protein